VSTALGGRRAAPDPVVRLHPVAPSKRTTKAISTVGPAAAAVRRASNDEKGFAVCDFIGIFRKQYAGSERTDAWHFTNSVSGNTRRTVNVTGFKLMTRYAHFNF